MKHIKLKASSNAYRLILSQDASLEDLFEEVKLFTNQLINVDRDKDQAKLVIESPNRILPESWRTEVQALIQRRAQWEVSFTSNVMSHERAVAWHKKVSLQVEFRSVLPGEILEVDGDILLVGDIHPAGYLRAGGNIFIIGRLEGIAHAGVDGDQEAVITGTFSDKSELRIAKASYSIDHLLDDKSTYTPRSYYITDRGQIEVASVDQIQKIRPGIDRVVNQLPTYDDFVEE